MDTIQTETIVERIVKGIQKHRHFDNETIVVSDEQYRMDYDRATMVVQILLQIVPEMGLDGMRETLTEIGFYPKTINTIINDYPCIY